MTGDAVAATIAHEVKQPLSAMVTNADAGLRWLDRSLPDLDEAKAAFKKIAADGHRAGAVIESIRAIFKRDARNRTSLDINELINEALILLGSDLQKHRIFVQTEPSLQLPQVIGDRIQLQQVLLNLITNAIDSMASDDGSRVLSIKSEVQDGGGVMISVSDTGKGIGSQDVGRIFNPLFTTNRAVWAWACRSAALSSRPTRDGCGLPGIHREVRCFNLSCGPNTAGSTVDSASARRTVPIAAA